MRKEIKKVSHSGKQRGRAQSSAKPISIWPHSTKAQQFINAALRNRMLTNILIKCYQGTQCSILSSSHIVLVDTCPALQRPSVHGCTVYSKVIARGTNKDVGRIVKRRL